MTRGFRRFLRRNTIGLLALFIALSGTTYAATALPKNSVGTIQLKKNAVTAAKIKNGSATNTKIGANAITGAKVKNDSLTGGDILESSLGKVPAAAAADSATNATHATTADTATTATHATTADTATTAANANALNGYAANGLIRIRPRVQRQLGCARSERHDCDQRFDNGTSCRLRPSDRRLQHHRDGVSL